MTFLLKPIDVADDSSLFLVLHRRLLGWFSFSAQKLLASVDFDRRSTFIQVVSLRLRCCLPLFALQNYFYSVFEDLSMLSLTVHFCVFVLLGICSVYFFYQFGRKLWLILLLIIWVLWRGQKRSTPGDLLGKPVHMSGFVWADVGSRLRP